MIHLFRHAGDGVVLSRTGRAAASAGLAALALAGLAGPAGAVTRTTTTINGFVVDRVVWTDSAGLKRSVSLKKQGSGNAGNGGYAIQMTYQIKTKAGPIKPVRLNAQNGEGFGYFVSHERERAFTSLPKPNLPPTIAWQIFNTDDSPLGRGFPVTTTYVPGPGKLSVNFTLNYRRAGTIAATTIDPNTGLDSPKLDPNPALYKLYDVPVTITWRFQDGRDFPRIINEMNLVNIPGPDRISVDLRAPYGKLDFDSGDNPINRVQWADRYEFRTLSAPAGITRNTPWVWSIRNTKSRYVALTAGKYEMGLIEPFTFRTTRTTDGYSEGRSKTSATYNGGNGCPFQNQKLPCDYEWAYQSAQYELPYDNPNGVTTSEKLAWGSTPFYGTSLPSSYDGTTAAPLKGFPADKKIRYAVCVAVGLATSGGFVRGKAVGGGDYSCAD
jgi:hypothetical protein